MRRTIAFAAGLLLTWGSAGAAEIVSASAKNIGTARWQVDIAFTQGAAGREDFVFLIELFPENGGNKCMRLNTGQTNQTVKYSIVCRGVPFGARYFTATAKTVNPRYDSPPFRVDLK